MFHVKQFILVLLCVVTTFGGIAQGSVELPDKPFVIKIVRDQELQTWLDAQTFYDKLSQDEKEMLYWVNVLRKDPKSFYDTYVTEFVKQYPEVKGGNVNSLKADSYKAARLPMLKPFETLHTEARSQANDVAKNQRSLSHSNSKGQSFQQRMQARGITKCAGENIYEGKNDPLKALILLLIDEGVPGTGHRKALLEPQFDLFGSGFAQRGDKFIVVQDFSCQ
jgi:hypothetical protein